MSSVKVCAGGWFRVLQSCDSGCVLMRCESCGSEKVVHRPGCPNG